MATCTTRVHPTIISKGYRKAESIAISALDEIGVIADQEQILNTIETALDGKISASSKSHLASLAFQAASQIAQEAKDGLNIDLSKVVSLPRVGGKKSRLRGS